MALDGVLANIPGLAGYLAMQDYQQRQALGGLQGAMGVLQAVQRQEEAQRQAQMAPLQMQAMQAQVQQQQMAADAAKKREAFFANRGQYMTPGAPAVAPGQGVTGGMDSGATGQIMGAAPAENGAPAARPEAAPQFNLDRFVADGAAQGIFSPETLLNRQSQIEERKAAREQRMQELGMRLLDARTTAQERMQLQRDLAQMQIEARRDMANLAASLRQPRQDPLVQVEINDPANPGQKTLRYVPQSQAAGMSPPTKATADKPLTEFQGKAVMFGSRAAQSDKVLKDLEDKVSTVGLAVKQAAQGVPLVGGVLGAAGNSMLSDNAQRVEQAQRDFVNALLRQESGAVISENEFENAKKQYFPQPGDSKAVIEQKRKNRAIAIGGFKRMAGPGGTEIDSIINAPTLPAAPAAAPAGEWSITRKK